MDTNEQMMALRAHQRGGPEVLVYEEAPRPRPGTSEVLVAVRAAAITPAELTWPETWETAGTDRTPIIPSHEFAGVVAESETDELAVGDEVFGLVPFDRDGAAAEYVVVPADVVVKKPPAVPYAVAAAAALPALTAWEALNEHAKVKAGERVLIRGGGGAVGSFLVQFARDLGAQVTTVVSSESSRARMQVLGAQEVAVGAVDEEAAFDVAIDAVGDALPEWAFAAVRRGGRLVTLQEPADAATADRYGVTAIFFVVTTRKEKLDELATLMADGHVEVAIAETFDLADGRAAYEPHHRPGPGKSVLLIGDQA